ncbi:phage Gp37/Gp68 family protein [Micromonospora sp. ATA32]|nr:phage Gp37/Gp68 family protein [Micromonospora sp. ATA32]
MGDTNIEWTQRPGTVGAVWNPTTGCDRISAGCDHCYALTMAKRLKGMGSAKYQTDGDPRTSGPGFGVAIHPGELEKPRSWRKPRTVFVNSMSDLFHARVPGEHIARVWQTMATTSRHTYQILTKRPERMRDWVNRCKVSPNGWITHDGTDPGGAYDGTGIIVGYPEPTWQPGLDRGPRGGKLRGRGQPRAYGWPLSNVWLGTSIESDKHVGRADALRATPAAVRFISAEPLLGPLPSLDLTGIDWLILGGESGAGARPLNVGWFHDLVDKAQDSGTAVFVKQLGAVWAQDTHVAGQPVARTDPKGGKLEYLPKALRIREYPTPRLAVA